MAQEAVAAEAEAVDLVAEAEVEALEVEASEEDLAPVDSEAVRAPVDSEVLTIIHPIITITTAPISAGVGVPDIITSEEEADASVLLQVWYSLQFSSYLC